MKLDIIFEIDSCVLQHSPMIFLHKMISAVVIVEIGRVSY